MKILKMTPSDTRAVAELEKSIFSDPWSEGDVCELVCNDGGMCYCAKGEDGELLAYVIGRIIPPEGEIYRIATKESARRRGIAYRLLDHTVRERKPEGLESLFLEVRSENRAARGLYLSYGFREIGLRRNYYKNPTDDAVVMLLSCGEEI